VKTMAARLLSFMVRAGPCSHLPEGAPENVYVDVNRFVPAVHADRYTFECF